MKAVISGSQQGPVSKPADGPPVETGWAVNLRFLVWSLTASGLILAALAVWYHHQVRRHADALLERARGLYGKEEWRAASMSFHQYLQLQPDEEHRKEALLLRARAFDKFALENEQQKRTTSFYFQALEANPDAQDARLRLAELLLQTARYREAAEQARQVLDALPDEVRAARVVAASLRQQLGTSRAQGDPENTAGAADEVKIDEVIKAYQKYLERFPGDIPLSFGLADLLRRNFEILEHGSRFSARDEADRVVDEMLSKHPGDAEALLAGFQYVTAFRLPPARQNLLRAEQGSRSNEEVEAARRALDHLLEYAGGMLREARELAPTDVDVLVQSAMFEAGLADRKWLSADESRDFRERAEKLAEHLIEIAPADWRSYVTSASIRSNRNEFDAAIAVLTAGLKKVPENFQIELDRKLLPLYIATGDTAGAEATLERIRPEFRSWSLKVQGARTAQRRRLAEEIDLAEVQLELLKGHVTTALPRLKQLAAGVTESENPEETLREQQRRLRMLAGAYAGAGQHDLAGAAYDELIRLNPQLVEYRLLAADQWRTSGDVDRAVGHLEAALANNSIPAAWLDLAQLRLDRQLRKAAVESWDFRGVDAALKTAGQQLGEVPALLLVRAAAAIARDNRDGAVADLRKIADEKDLDVGLLPRLAALQQYAGDAESADATLERFRNSKGNISVWALAQAEILRIRGDTAGASRVLEETLAQVPESARGPLLRRLIALEIESGAIRSARRRLRELRRVHSPDLWVYDTAADLAIMAGDYEDLKECEEQVARVELDGSRSRYFQAVRLLETEKDAEKAAAVANPLCRELEALRPTWAMTRLLRGRIEERLGQIAAAAENYELALRSGSKNLTVFQWLVANLYRQQRYSDASAYIKQGGQVASLAGNNLWAVAIPPNLKAGRIEDAVRLARSAAEIRATDFLTQVWYGQTLALADRPAEAEEVFRKAIGLESGRRDIRSWSALVWFYVRQKRLPEARQALADLITNVTLTGVDRELVRARGSDLIGDREDAERHYENALADNPRNLNLLGEVGQFYFRFDHEKALDAFRRAWEIDPTSLKSRRAVALLTGLRGTDADLTSALSILDSEEEPAEIADRRLQAALLVVRGGAGNAAKAVTLMKGLVEKQEQPTIGDRLLLARALEESRQVEEAKEQFIKVLKEGETSAALLLYIDFLNRNEQTDDAGATLARLETLDPENVRLLGLKIEWLMASHRASEIEETIDRGLAARVAAAKSDEQRAALDRYAAELLTRARLYDPAEKKLREAVRLVPASYETLALWLVERDRLNDALGLCLEKTSGEGLARQATTLVRVLTIAAARSVAAGPAQAKAEATIADALKLLPARGSAAAPKESGRPTDEEVLSLALETGVLRLMQGRNDEALALYEVALKIEPRNAVVLNNRAVVLSEMPGRAADALNDIDQALATVPNSVELLDSKALVLIGIGNFEESRAILERLCQTHRRNARYRLHLAFALHSLADRKSAREQLDQALRDGLEREILTPSERRYQEEISASGKAAERDGPVRRLPE